MIWSIEFLEEAEKDMKKLDHSAQIQVLKGIKKVSQNPLSVREGGYGKPLGNKSGTNLTNLMKIKFRDLGIRVVYKVERVGKVMKIIVVSARTDEQVYNEAAKRRDRYDCNGHGRRWTGSVSVLGKCEAGSVCVDAWHAYCKHAVYNGMAQTDK